MNVQEVTPDDLIGAKLVYTIIDYGKVSALRQQYTDDETPILVNVTGNEYLQTLIGDEKYSDHECFVLEFFEIAEEVS